MHLQIQQLESRISQLQRELSSLSSQIHQMSSASSYSGAAGMSGGMGGFGGSRGMGGMSWSGSQQGFPGNVASFTPSHSDTAGVGDFGGPGYWNSGLSHGWSSGNIGSGNYGGYASGMGGGSFSGGGFSGSGIGSGGQPHNIASYTSPSPLAGSVVDSPLGRQDYGVSGGQAFKLGQY